MKQTSGRCSHCQLPSTRRQQINDLLPVSQECSPQKKGVDSTNAATQDSDSYNSTSLTAITRMNQQEADNKRQLHQCHNTNQQQQSNNTLTSDKLICKYYKSCEFERQQCNSNKLPFSSLLAVNGSKYIRCISVHLQLPSILIETIRLVVDLPIVVDAVELELNKVQPCNSL